MARMVDYLMDRGPCKGEARPAIVVSENEDGERPEDVKLLGNEVIEVADAAPGTVGDQPVAVNEDGGNEDGGKQAARVNKRRNSRSERERDEEGVPGAHPADARFRPGRSAEMVNPEGRDADGGRRIEGTVNLLVFADRDKDNVKDFLLYRANVSRGSEPGNYK
jgi:hypothetical protein